MRYGGPGRAQISPMDQSTADTVQLAFLAMKSAAYMMVDVHDPNIEILPSCTVDEVRACDSRLGATVDHTGLILNSLLVPAKSSTLDSPSRIRFAHRAYQEFFLASFIKENPEAFPGLEIPDSVNQWLVDLHSESA